jgi:hypothetical protein
LNSGLFVALLNFSQHLKDLLSRFATCFLKPVLHGQQVRANLNNDGLFPALPAADSLAGQLFVHVVGCAALGAGKRDHDFPFRGGQAFAATPNPPTALTASLRALL